MKAKGHLHLSKYGEDICYCPPMYWRPVETAKMVTPWFQLLCIGAKLASFEVKKNSIYTNLLTWNKKQIKYVITMKSTLNKLRQVTN